MPAVVIDVQVDLVVEQGSTERGDEHAGATDLGKGVEHLGKDAAGGAAEGVDKVKKGLGGLLGQ